LTRPLVLLGLVLGACGGPSTGDTVERTGVITDGVCRVLRASDGEFALFGPQARSLRPGQRVKVVGESAEFTTCMISGIRVERVRALD